MIAGKRLLGILVAAGVTALGNARAQNPVIDWNSATIVVVGTVTRMSTFLRSESGKAEFLSVMFHHMPHKPLRHAITPPLSSSAYASKQFSRVESGFTSASVYCRFDPIRHRHSLNVATFCQLDRRSPCSMLPAFEFQARPVIPVADAIRVELEAMAWRDSFKDK